MLLPEYGIDAAALPPPWSLVFSITMIFGISGIGYLFQSLLSGKSLHLFESSWERGGYSPIIGAAISGALIYPALLFGSHARTWLTILAYLVVAMGVIFIIFIFQHILNQVAGINLLSNKKITQIYQQLLSQPYLIFLGLLVIGLTFMSFGPPTDGDELDYHIGVPLAILNSGNWVFAPEWFHSRLAGMGEGLITLGMSIGAEQFGALLQLSGLIAIVTLLSANNKNPDAFRTRFLYPLIFCCSPVLLWLTSTSKPFLLPVAMIAISLRLLLPAIDHPQLKAHLALARYCTATALLLCASQMKFSFLLSSFLVGISWLFFMHRKGLTRQALAIGLILSTCILLPPSIWKAEHYGGAWYESIYQIFTGNWPGYVQFHYVLTHWREATIFPFPVNLFITEVPGQAATIIGIGVIIWLFGIGHLLINKNVNGTGKFLGLISLMFTILAIVLGQFGARFYIEPLIWALLALAIQTTPNPRFILNPLLIFGIRIQSLAVIAGSFYCAFLLAPGAFTQAWRTATLDKMAFQHSEMQWIDKSLPQEAIILSELRPKAQLPRQSISLDWSAYMDPHTSEATVYLKRIKESGATHLVTSTNPLAGNWAKCIRPNIIGPRSSHYAARNPFNRGAPYSVWIAELNIDELPDCMLNP